MFGTEVNVRVCWFHVSRNLVSQVTDKLTFQYISELTGMFLGGFAVESLSVLVVFAAELVKARVSNKRKAAGDSDPAAMGPVALTDEQLKSCKDRAVKVAQDVKCVMEKMTRLRHGEIERLEALYRDVFACFGNPVPVADERLTADHAVREIHRQYPLHIAQDLLDFSQYDGLRCPQCMPPPSRGEPGIRGTTLSLRLDQLRVNVRVSALCLERLVIVGLTVC